MLKEAVSEITEYELERNKPMPSLNHALVQTSLIMALAPYSKIYRFASELNLDLEEWSSVPDLCILSPLQPNFREDQVAVTEPPLGIIEIVSPSQSLNQLVTKAESYFAHGVQSCWLVLLPLTNIYVFSDPNNYQIFREHEILHDTVLDIKIALSEVFG
jgi:Uma2 family endonuclease